MDHGDIIAKILDDKDKNYLTVFFSLNGERKKALNDTLDYFKTKCVIPVEYFFLKINKHP